MRILGIDPGSRNTGLGIIDQAVNKSTLVAAETLRLGGGAMPERLSAIFDGVQTIIKTYRPDVMAIETVFMNRDAQAAIKLGQARGAAICAAVQLNLEVHEYAPRLIKQAVVGRGGADKVQIQHMVKVLLGVKQKLSADAFDALAVALCHSHTAQTVSRLPAGVTLR